MEKPSNTEDLKQRIKDLQSINIYERSELKGRAKIFLETKLKPLLQTAYEFATLDPPRTNVVVERLEMALDQIKREIEQLDHWRNK